MRRNPHEKVEHLMGKFCLWNLKKKKKKNLFITIWKIHFCEPISQLINLILYVWLKHFLIDIPIENGCYRLRNSSNFPIFKANQIFSKTSFLFISNYWVLPDTCIHKATNPVKIRKPKKGSCLMYSGQELNIT